MKKVYLLSALLSLITMAGCLDKPEKEEPVDPTDPNQPALTSVSFEKSSNTALSKSITLQQVASQKLFWGYLPNDVPLTALKATFVAANGDLYIANAKQQSGGSSQNYSSPVTFEVRGEGTLKATYTVKLYPYTGLPYVYFTTTEGKVFSETVKNKEDWMAARINIDALGLTGLENYNGDVELRGRGNATWKRMDKKPFNMKMAIKDPILGMPKHKRWCFLANWRDRTLLRNDVAFHVGHILSADKTGMEWAPHGSYAEVVFNGQYMGNYYIAEHVRVDKNRVNIDEMNPVDISGDNLTGGYLLELDFNYDEDPKFKSSVFGTKIMLKSPSLDDDGNFPNEQLSYIASYVNRVETLLQAKNFSDLYDSLDMNSFVDFWLAAAITGNAEFDHVIDSENSRATPASTFLYKKRLGKIYAGPIWDFDYTAFATGSKTYNGRSTMMSGSWWYKHLLTDPDFIAAAKARFTALETDLRAVPAYITAQGNKLAKSEAVDRAKWPLNATTLDGFKATLNGDENLTMAPFNQEATPTYQDAVNRMITIYNKRLVNVNAYLNTGTWPE